MLKFCLTVPCNILRNRYIVINGNLDTINARIVCTHEIGHDHFHRSLDINMFQDKLCVSIKAAIPEIEVNYYVAKFLIADNDILELSADNITYSQITSTLGVHTELAMIKTQLLNSKDYKLNTSYVPNANFLGKIGGA